MTRIYHLAFDLGATSGRCILGYIRDGKICTKELTRFKHDRIIEGSHQYWNLDLLFREIKHGIAVAAAQHIHISSIGIDTWGVDFVCIDKSGRIMGRPHSYRDHMTEISMKKYLSDVRDAEKLYMATGIQLMNFNTLFQLYAMKMENSDILANTDKILFLPDALTYMLTGEMLCEYTIASTSQFLNPYTRQIDSEILKEVGLSESHFCDVTLPGKIAGYVKDEILKEIGIDYKIPVISVAGHDTACAIAAVPASNDNFAFLSSGTWSLMGIETQKPIINAMSFSMEVTNEGGYEGKIEILKNITGMWLLEECLKEWKINYGKEYSYDEIVSMADRIPSFSSIIDPDNDIFRCPTSMTEAIRTYCKETSQKIPENDREIVNCIFVSLALKYKETLDALDSLTKAKIEYLHIIGGGAKNEIMNRYTCNATGLTVTAGPSEASASGNILIQAVASGTISGGKEMRNIVLGSYNTTYYTPEDIDIWQDGYRKYKEITTTH